MTPKEKKVWIIKDNEIKQGKINSICAVNRNIDNWEQNIKLIAAAPEMLECLKKIKAKLEDATFWEQVDKVVLNDIDPILKKIGAVH